MNTDNVEGILEYAIEVLSFYASSKNYKNGRITLDEGAQAKTAINLLKKQIEFNKKNEEFIDVNEESTQKTFNTELGSVIKDLEKLMKYV